MYHISPICPICPLENVGGGVQSKGMKENKLSRKDKNMNTHKVIENTIVVKDYDRTAKCECGGDLSGFWLDSESDRVARWSKWSCRKAGA